MLINMLIKLKANINLAFKNIAKNIDKRLHCIASHPLLKLHNDCMARCNYSMHQIGYEPAGLTVHPPPQNDREWVHFFRMGV